MREILFRGKDTNGSWQYGDYIRYNEEFCNIKDTTIYRHSHLCRTKTVGQYTGLTDKNGIKIFEGDIVEYNGTKHKVVFEDRGGTSYFGIVISDNETWSFGLTVPADLMNVIGNTNE